MPMLLRTLLYLRFEIFVSDKSEILAGETPRASTYPVVINTYLTIVNKYANFGMRYARFKNNLSLVGLNPNQVYGFRRFLVCHN